MSSASSAVVPAAAPVLAAGEGRSERRLDLLMAAAAVILAAMVFGGTIHGDWVYDDEPLILANPMIQDSRFFWTSLTSDVFAYRSAMGEAGSPYWRPVTMLWFIAHHRLYGVESTLGWHIGSIALHTLATLLAFLVMRRLGMGPLLAGAAAWIFAVHPTRTENVAWISGVPDLLVAVGLLGAMWFMLGVIAAREGTAGAPAPERKRAIPWGLWAGAVGLYLVALGSKEFAIVFPIIVFAAALRWRGRAADGGGMRLDLSSWKSAAALAAPFAVMAAAYLVIRAPIVAGATAHSEGPGLVGAIRSIPLTGAFYLRQMVLPFWIGPSYPLRPVVTPSIFNFILPGIVVGAAGAGMLWLAFGRFGSRAAMLGVVLFVLTIAPAGLAAGVSPELMVQDRYLYLPLLGFVIVALAGAHAVLALRMSGAGIGGGIGGGGRRAEAVIAVCAAVACIPLAAQTFRYSGAWMSSIDLWAWGVRNDPSSRFPWGQYGVALIRAGKNDEAMAALDRAVALRATVSNTLARIDLSIRMERYDEAEALATALLREMDARPHTIERYQAVELLVRIALLRDGDVDRAIALLRDIREKLPNFRAMITDRMAVILIVEERPDEALAELESARPHIATDRSQEARWVCYRIGQLYARVGRLDEARDAFEEFLRQTEGTGNAKMLDARGLAAEAIEVIRRGPQTPQAAPPPPEGAPAPAPAAPGPGGE